MSTTVQVAICLTVVALFLWAVLWGIDRLLKNSLKKRFYSHECPPPPPTPEPKLKSLPPVREVLVPEGSKLTPAYYVKIPFFGMRYNDKEVGITLDANEALQFQLNTSAEVVLIGVYRLPDGRCFQGQEITPMKVIDKDVRILEDGTITIIEKNDSTDIS